jgi:hypothetical protein
MRGFFTIKLDCAVFAVSGLAVILPLEVYNVAI